MTNYHNFTLMQEVKIFWVKLKPVCVSQVLAQTEVLLACTVIEMHI